MTSTRCTVEGGVSDERPVKKIVCTKRSEIPRTCSTVEAHFTSEGWRSGSNK